MKNIISTFFLFFIVLVSIFGQNNNSFERKIISKTISKTNEYHRVIPFLKSSDWNKFYSFFPLDLEAEIFSTLRTSENFGKNISYEDYIKEMKLFQPTRSNIDANILECKNLFFETDFSGTIEVVVDREEVYYTKKIDNNPLTVKNNNETIYEEIPYRCNIQLIYKWRFKLNNELIFGEMGLSTAKLNNEFLELELVSIKSNGNPEINEIFYPTHKDNPILINDYKSFFKSEVEGINIVWFNEKIKKNDLLSDYKLDKRVIKDNKSGYFKQKIIQRTPLTLAFWPQINNFTNEFILSQNPNGFSSNLSFQLYVNENKNIYGGAKLNLISGTNEVYTSNRSYSYADTDPDNYNYTRNVSINNFQENIDLNFMYAKIFLGYDFQKILPNDKFNISINAGYNFNLNSQITSSREASISYSGSYPYLYDITIEDGIYDFGKYTVNQNSTIDLDIFDPVSFEFNIEYKIAENLIFVINSEFTSDNVISFYNPIDKVKYFSQNQNELNSIFDVQNSYVKSNPITIGIKTKF